MAGLVLNTTFNAVDRFSAPMKKMSASLAGLNRRVKKMTPSMGGMAKQFASFALAGAGIALLGNAVNVIKDFEQANADLSAVMSTATIPQLKLLKTEAIRIGSSTSRTATEVVGLQESLARLGFETPAIVNMTESVVRGADAMNAGLAETAELTGSVVRTFSNFSSIDTADIIDKLTLATQKSALSFEKYQTALPNVSAAANAAGVGFEEMLAILGKLSDAGVDASSSSTALRNIFIDSEAKGHSYKEIIANITKNQHKLTAASDEFGKRGSISATILSEKMGEVSKLTKELQKNFKGTAADAQTKRLNTLTGSVALLTSAWEGLLIQGDEASGATKILGKAIRFLAENLDVIIPVVVVLLGLLVLFKIAMFAVAIATNAAIWPITLIVLGIIALIAIIILVVKHWDKWRSAVLLLLGPIGMVIHAFMILKKHWGNITKAFTTKGIWGGLKAIGLAIVDFLISPIEALINMLSYIPGLEDLMSGAQGALNDVKASLGLDLIGAEPKKIDNNQARTESFEQQIISSRSEGTLNIAGAPAGTTLDYSGGFMDINLSSTMEQK